MKKIKRIISNGEGITVEFKKSRNKVTSDVYESICAFLNRNGGQVILGVEDNGTISGIKENALDQMKKDLVTALNNPQKLNPPLYILPDCFIRTINPVNKGLHCRLFYFLERMMLF